MILTPSQARTFYDRFGSWQDTQGFYEDTALDALIAHAHFERAQSVFELGCGTGRFASSLLKKHLPRGASYLGIDISNTMINIASERLAPYAGRAKVTHCNGSIVFPFPDRSVDRVVSTYVFDLLSEKAIDQALCEAHRVLTPGGKLCLVSLTEGTTPVSRAVSGIWSMLFRLYAPMVGGCRPVRLESLMDRQQWSVEYRSVVTPFGVPSEVLVAAPRMHTQRGGLGRTQCN